MAYVREESVLVDDRILRDAIKRKAAVIYGNSEFSTFIQQTREFYNQFKPAPGVDVNGDAKLLGTIGHMQGVRIVVVPDEHALPYLHIRVSY